ncbi:hypothetical protein PAMP_010752 [Pampus punctatissimus]
MDSGSRQPCSQWTTHSTSCATDASCPDKNRNHDQKFSTSSLQFKTGIAVQLCGTEESTSVPAEPVTAEDVTSLEEEDLTDIGVVMSMTSTLSLSIT